MIEEMKDMIIDEMPAKYTLSEAFLVVVATALFLAAIAATL